MKLSKLSQLVVVSATGLILATTLTACNIVTIDYVFVAASAGTTAGSAGQIYTYAADAESGALRTVRNPVSSGGMSPVAMAVNGAYSDLYVANQGAGGSNYSVVHFSIAGNGTLTQKDTLTTNGVPVSLAVNAAGTYLYVITGTASATLTEYALSSGAIGSATASETFTVPGFASDSLISTAVMVLPNSSAVFVAAYDRSAYNPGGTVTSSAHSGWIFGSAVCTSGALFGPSTSCGKSGSNSYDSYQAGVEPTSLTADPTNRFVYATDYADNELVGYTVQDGSVLNFMVYGPFKTGNGPSSVIIDPRGIYIYVPNSLDSTVSSYSILLATGAPSAAVSTAGTAANQTDTDPTSITLDPALGRYVYTANHLGNSISGFRLNPNTGVLSLSQATPYPTGAAPTAIIAVPHGNHAVQVVSD